jgi:hypothetical protein
MVYEELPYIEQSSCGICRAVIKQYRQRKRERERARNSMFSRLMSVSSGAFLYGLNETTAVLINT